MNTQKVQKCDRNFRWISSVTGDAQILSQLNEQMTRFYAQKEKRELYQLMLDSIEENPKDLNSVSHLMPKYICNLAPKQVLEIGCGNGRLYRQLRRYGFKGDYCGIEVAEWVVERNRKNHPSRSCLASWSCL